MQPTGRIRRPLARPVGGECVRGREHVMRSTALVVIALSVAGVACSNSNTSDTGGTESAVASVVATGTTSAAANSNAEEQAGLSGTWDGSYSGASKGTFTLERQQTGSKLSGTIDLSSVGKLPIDGTVDGDKISFGTVGSTAIQHAGSVTGDSMSGSYKVAGGAGSGTGSWSAQRAS
jgi:hypothetical protein